MSEENIQDKIVRVEDKAEKKVKELPRTVRLEIFLKVKDLTVEDREIQNQRLRQLWDETRRSANLIVSGQYLNDSIARTLYARNKVDTQARPKIEKRLRELSETLKHSEPSRETKLLEKEQVTLTEKLAEIKAGTEHVEETLRDMFGGTLRQATTERDIQAIFPTLPSAITNGLNEKIYSEYKIAKTEVMSGNASLRSYKKNMPVPARATSVKFRNDGTYHELVWNLGRSGEVFRFGVVYGKDKIGNRKLVQEIIDGKRRFYSSSFQIKKKKTYMLLVVKDAVADIQLDQNKSVGVDLGLRIPALVALNETFYQAIGDYDGLVRVRVQMQHRRRSLQRGLACAKGGHGRRHKLKALDDLEQKERNYVRNYNHLIARRVVDFAVRQSAGTIKLEFLKGFGKDGTKEFVLRNWSYFELQTMIEQNASKFGIRIVFVDPYHTSQTCSKCGHYEEDQRDAAKFKCKKCGMELGADLNAAINIAKSEKIVTKEEECEYWKLKRKEKEEAKRLLIQKESQPEQLVAVA